MTGERRALRVFVVLSLSLLPSLARAQVPEDSVYADSLAEDTVNQTARFLEAQQQIRERVPTMPPVPGRRSPASSSPETRSSGATRRR